MIPTTLNKICSILILNYASIKQPINVDPLVRAVQNIPFYVLSRLFTKALRRLLKYSLPLFPSLLCIHTYIYV